jgi:hypothetical protein
MKHVHQVGYNKLIDLIVVSNIEAVMAMKRYRKQAHFSIATV